MEREASVEGMSRDVARVRLMADAARGDAEGLRARRSPERPAS
jgi:hypothetical protein